MPQFWNWQRRGAALTEGSAAIAAQEELRPIQLYTAGGLLTAAVAPNGERMLDILNRQPHLRLKDADFTPYYTDTALSHSPGWMSVARDVVLLVAPPHSSPRQVHLHRRQRRVEISVPPFTLVGNAHMPPGFRLNDFVRRQHHAFIPVTEAWLRHDQNATFDRSVPVVLVNVSRVQGIRDLLA